MAHNALAITRLTMLFSLLMGSPNLYAVDLPHPLDFKGSELEKKK